MIFCEGSAALGTTESLKAVTMLTEALAGYLAVVASHGLFLRLISAGKAVTIFLGLECGSPRVLD